MGACSAGVQALSEGGDFCLRSLPRVRGIKRSMPPAPAGGSAQVAPLSDGPCTRALADNNEAKLTLALRGIDGRQVVLRIDIIYRNGARTSAG